MNEVVKYELGIYRGLSFAEYAAIPAWSTGAVLPFRISALQGHYERMHPKPITPAMRFGAAVHCSVLEPDQFPLRYVVWSNGARRGNDYKAFLEANEGKDVLKQDEYETCLAVRDAVHEHPLAGMLLDSGEKEDREVSVVWNDNETGLLCKGRPDMLLPEMIVDIKTTRVHIADTGALTRVASTLGYHIKLAAYQDGLCINLIPALPVKIIFAEQTPPHDVRVMSVPTNVLIQGWDEWQRLLGIIAECERTGIWPGCDAGEGELHVWSDAEQLPVTLDGESI